MTEKCIKCGRFISYKDIENEKVIEGYDRAWDGEPIGKWYEHKKCNVKCSFCEGKGQVKYICNDDIYGEHFQYRACHFCR